VGLAVVAALGHHPKNPPRNKKKWASNEWAVVNQQASHNQVTTRGKVEKRVNCVSKTLVNVQHIRWEVKVGRMKEPRSQAREGGRRMWRERERQAVPRR
jgi:hypothetical protein